MVIDCLRKYIRQAAGAALAVLLLAALTKLVSAQAPAINALPFSRGEELVYRAEFSRGLLRGVDVAEFRFKANTEHVSAPEGATGDPVTINLMGDVITKGLFVRVAGFHFHQHVESAVDPTPFWWPVTNPSGSPPFITCALSTCSASGSSAQTNSVR